MILLQEVIMLGYVGQVNVLFDTLTSFLIPIFFIYRIYSTTRFFSRIHNNIMCASTAVYILHFVFYHILFYYYYRIVLLLLLLLFLVREVLFLHFNAKECMYLPIV